MSITWTCKCGARTLAHIEWCAACGSSRPKPVEKPPSHVPTIKEITS